MNKTSMLLIVKVLFFLLKTNASKYARDSFLSFSYIGNNALDHYKATTNEIPHHVLIAYQSLYCSGALIGSKVVVTAASCFVKWQGQRIVVKVGSDIVTGIGQVIEAVEVKKHEYFAHSSVLDNDIAILMMKEHVVFDTNVKKIILTDVNMPLEPGSIIHVSGYAGQQPPKLANSLLFSEMTLLNKRECMTLYPGLITRSNFCAKYAAERRLIDNGGPAVLKEMLVGILSYGAHNTAEPFVAVLTNVSYFHKWITLNVKRFLLKYCIEPTRLPPESDIDMDNY